jgi:hypothetical protein
LQRAGGLSTVASLTTETEVTRVLQAEDFEPHVGKTFRFGQDGRSLVLERVERGTKPPTPELRAPFLVIFREPKQAEHLREGPVHCASEDGAVFELYLAPIHTPQPDRQEYQASFN